LEEEGGSCGQSGIAGLQEAGGGSGRGGVLLLPLPHSVYSLYIVARATVHVLLVTLIYEV
jgi:hypothetical protein